MISTLPPLLVPQLKIRMSSTHIGEEKQDAWMLKQQVCLIQPCVGSEVKCSHEHTVITKQLHTATDITILFFKRTTNLHIRLGLSDCNYQN